MPIVDSNEIRLRGTANDGRTDINEEINGNATDTDVSLGTLNTSAFTNVSDGSDPNGRAMSEMYGYSVFTSQIPTTESTGALGESLLLDATAQQVINYDIDIEGCHTAGTFSFWIKRNSLSSSNRQIIAYNADTGGANASNYWMQFNSDNRLYVGPAFYGTSSTDSYYSPDFIFSDTTSWYHIVLAIDTTKALAIDRICTYVNGIKLKDYHQAVFGDQNQDELSTTDKFIGIGEIYPSGTDPLAAVIADFKYIDGQQLTPDNFGKILNGVWIPQAFNTPSTDTFITTDLQVDIQFDSGAAVEEQGNYTLTVSNVDYLNKNYGIARFNSLSDKITLPLRNTDNILDNGVTYMAWVYTYDLDADSHAVFRNKDTSAETGVALNIGTTGQVSFGLQKSGHTVSANSPDGMIKEDRWHHVAGTQDDAYTVKLYIDGELVDTATSTQKISDLGSFTRNLTLGNRNAGSFDNFYGYIGEAQVYTNDLTSSQILQNYNATKHKYAYGLAGVSIPFNNTSTGNIDSSSDLLVHLDASNSSSYGGSGTTWTDLSGNNNHGTIIDSVPYSTNNGGYFDFDGAWTQSDTSADSISLPGALATGTNNFTIELWVNMDSTAMGSLYMQLDPLSPVTIFFGVNNSTYGGANDIYAGIYINGSTSYINTNNNVLPTNQWRHIVLVQSSAHRRIYVNGNVEAESTASSHTSNGTQVYTSEGPKNLIGAYKTTYYSSVFNGQIAQFRIYTKPLTQNEVITNYRATQGYYEQVSLVDISGNGNNFEITTGSVSHTDSVSDQPSDNFATLRTQSLLTGPSLTRGSLRCSNTNSYFAQFESTLAPTSGKWYAEVTVVDEGSNTLQIGAASERTIHWMGSTTNNINGGNTGYTIWNMDNDTSGFAVIYVDNSRPQTSTDYKVSDGDVCSILLNLDDNEITFYKNNVIVDQTRSITRDSDEPTFFVAHVRTNSGSGILDWNFGQKDFVYTIDSNYKALSTKNLPAPPMDPDGASADKPTNHFRAVSYRGTGETRGVDYGAFLGSNAAVFNGSSSYIAVGSPIPNTDTNAAISAWVKLSSGISSTMNITGTGITTSLSEAPFRATLSYVSANTFKIFGLRQVSGTYYYASTSSLTNVTINLDAWYHIVWSYNSTGRKLSTFLNGTAIDTDVAMTTSGGSVNDSSTVIGSFRSTSGPFFDGDLDQIRFYTSSLTAQQVDYIYRNDTSNIPGTSDGLVAYYNLNHNANDTSGSATTYNGTENNITYTSDEPTDNIDVGFQPDLVWLKNRTEGYIHAIYDSVRGAGNASISNQLSSDTNNSSSWHSNIYGYLSSFDTNGFSLKKGTTDANAVNRVNNDYVAYAFKAGGKAVTNTSGDITSQISANTDAGFSIVKYEGSGSLGETVAHGLDEAPEIVITKRTNLTEDWYVFTTAIDGSHDYFILNDTDGKADSAIQLPTDNYIKSRQNGIIINYCFHSVSGFSKIDTYNGNGNNNGPFINTGFKPAFVMVKNIANGHSWLAYDNAREQTNNLGEILYLDSHIAVNPIGNRMSFESNGFRLRTNNSSHNALNNTYLYMAFADDPSKYSNATANLGIGNDYTDKNNQPSKNVSTTLYAGTSSDNYIDVGFDMKTYGGLLMIKDRSGTNHWAIVDSVRDVDPSGTPYLATNQNITDTTTSTNMPKEFTRNGFIVQGSGGRTNANGTNYIVYAFKAGGYANTYNVLENGVISSDASASNLGLDTGTFNPTGISANRDNGFSIIKYTGPGSACSFAHGLNRAPQVIMFKATNTTDSWLVFTSVLNRRFDYLHNTDDGLDNPTLTQWTSSDLPDSKNIYFGASSGVINDTSGTQQMIAYAWHSVPGFSKIGFYTGRGLNNGVRVTTGFKPGIVFIKNLSDASQWLSYNLENSNNVMTSGDHKLDDIIYLSLNNAETPVSTAWISVQEDSFTINSGTGSTSLNKSGSKYLYMAFAKS